MKISISNEQLPSRDVLVPGGHMTIPARKVRVLRIESRYEDGTTDNQIINDVINSLCNQLFDLTHE